MGIEQLKESLHKQIEALENPFALQLLHDAAVDYNRTPEKDCVDDLTTEQKNRLAISLQQAADGNTVPHDDAMKLIRKWRNK